MNVDISSSLLYTESILSERIQDFIFDFLINNEQKFEQNVSKIDPKVDIHRATSIIDDYIMMI